MTAGKTPRHVPLSFERPTCTVGQVYPELMRALCALLERTHEGSLTSKCWYGTFYRWFLKDLDLWDSERTTRHHLQAFGGMGSFNDPVLGNDFPGGSEDFERFCKAHRLLKELSYTSGQLWDEARSRYPGQLHRDVLITFRGIPVSICTCRNGHRWMRDELTVPFYLSSAANIAEMNSGFELVAQRGGEAAEEWLSRNELAFDPEPVLADMRAAVDCLGLEPRPDDCKACRKKPVDSEILYLIGFPMVLSQEFFRVELA